MGERKDHPNLIESQLGDAKNDVKNLKLVFWAAVHNVKALDKDHTLFNQL